MISTLLKRTSGPDNRRYAVKSGRSIVFLPTSGLFVALLLFGMALTVSFTSSRAEANIGAAVQTQVSGTVIDDPLTDGAFTGVEMLGGQFEPDGWRSLTSSDHLYYKLPDGMLEATLEFDAKGFQIPTSGEDGRRHMFAVYDGFQSDGYEVDETNRLTL